MMRFRMFRINVEQFAILAENAQLEKLDIATGLEIKYSLEGMVAFSTTVRIKPAPPRGINTST